MISVLWKSCVQPSCQHWIHALSVCGDILFQHTQTVITCCILCFTRGKTASVSAVLFSGAASPQTLDPGLTEANPLASQPGLPASQPSTTADPTTLGRGSGLQPCSQGGATNGGCHGYGAA